MTEILCIQCSVSGKTYVLSIASGRSGQITVWITVLEHAKPELPRLICACSSDLSPVCSAGAGTMPITGLEPVRAVTLITSFVKRHPLVSVIAKDCIAFYFLHRPMAFPGCFFALVPKPCQVQSDQYICVQQSKSSYVRTQDLGRDILHKFKDKKQNTSWKVTEKNVQKWKQSSCSKIKMKRRKQNYHLKTGMTRKKEHREKSSHKSKVKETGFSAMPTMWEGVNKNYWEPPGCSLGPHEEVKV